MITLHLLRTGGGKYIERGGMIANENGSMGVCYTDIFELDWYGFSRSEEHTSELQSLSMIPHGEPLIWKSSKPTKTTAISRSFT